MNPAVWAIRLYHLLYALAHAAHQRQCEYAADREEVKQSGAQAAAQALLLLTASERMSWTRLSSLADARVQSSLPVHQLFKEQARAIGPDDWQDAIRKELKKSTGAFDSHPGLKDRLAAMGVSAKQAVKLTPELSAPPSYDLFDHWWPKLETQLAERLLIPFRDAHIAKMESARWFPLSTGCRAGRGRSAVSGVVFRVALPERAREVRGAPSRPFRACHPFGRRAGRARSTLSAIDFPVARLEKA